MDVRSNLAYDYSQFEEKQNNQKPQIKKVPKRKNAQKGISVLKSVSYLMVAVVVLGVLIYSRATQAELEAEYTATKKEINQVTNQNVILQNKVESQLSLKNIEVIARDRLGLQKVDNAQIECINFDIKNKAEIVKKQSLWNKVCDFVSNLFN